MSTRNVIDKYSAWTEDLIREDLKKKSFPYAAMMENWQGDFNLATLIRNANAFGAKEVFYIGNKKWDRRAAVGTHIYTSVNHLKDYTELSALKARYTLIGVDNIPGAVPIEDFEWPENPLMIFGEEGTGLTKEMQGHCQKMVYITQFGSVRSINAGCASAIAFYDFVKKYNETNTKKRRMFGWNPMFFMQKLASLWQK